ncbi:MAG: mannosyltransferase family protein [Thermoguttaceae bacterium]
MQLWKTKRLKRRGAVWIAIRPWREGSFRAVLWAFFSGLMVVGLGLAFGLYVMPPSGGPHSPLHVPGSGSAVIDALICWDGQWYLEVAERGYSYDPDRESSVAFFPGYPLTIAAMCRLTKAPANYVAIAVSLVFLLASMTILYDYARRRFPADRPRLAGLVVLSMALFPTTFFFRMAYSESLFFFLTIAVLYGMQRGWSLRAIAGLVGLATATRLAGAALLPLLIGYAWRREAPLSHNLIAVVASMAVGLSGLLAYIAFQKYFFNAPWAFVQAQESWCKHFPHNWLDKAIGLASWQPVWSAYLQDSAGYAGHVLDPAPGLINLQFANPVFFVAAIILIAVGAWMGWLSGNEILLASGLLFVCYAGRGFEMCMASQGRFVAAVFPMYLVLGNILDRVPRPCANAIFALLGTYLAIYSAMLAAGYVLI